LTEDEELDNRLEVLKAVQRRERKRRRNIEALERVEDRDAPTEPERPTSPKRPRSEAWPKLSLPILKHKGLSWGELNNLLYKLEGRLALYDEEFQPDIQKIVYASKCTGWSYREAVDCRSSEPLRRPREISSQEYYEGVVVGRDCRRVYPCPRSSCEAGGPQAARRSEVQQLPECLLDCRNRVILRFTPDAPGGQPPQSVEANPAVTDHQSRRS